MEVGLPDIASQAVFRMRILLRTRGKFESFALTLPTIARQPYPQSAGFFRPLACLRSHSNVVHRHLSYVIPSIAIAFFDAILLKNVGDSPYSVRFCRNFEPFLLLSNLNSS